MKIFFKKIIAVIFFILLICIIYYTNKNYESNITDDQLQNFEQYILEKYPTQNYSSINLYFTEEKVKTISGNKDSDMILFVHLIPSNSFRRNFEYCIIETTYSPFESISSLRQRDWTLIIELIDEGVYSVNKNITTPNNTSFNLNNISLGVSCDKGDAISSVSIDSNMNNFTIGYNFYQPLEEIILNSSILDINNYESSKESNRSSFSNDLQTGFVRDLGIFSDNTLKYNNSIIINFGIDKFIEDNYLDQEMNFILSYSINKNKDNYVFQNNLDFFYDSIYYD